MERAFELIMYGRDRGMPEKHYVSGVYKLVRRLRGLPCLPIGTEIKFNGKGYMRIGLKKPYGSFVGREINFPKGSLLFSGKTRWGSSLSRG